MTNPIHRTWTRLTGWSATTPWASLTVWAALLFILAASVARAFTYPPLGSADEPAHLDYVVTVWHGHLPVFENGLTYRVPWGVQVPVQWVAQHPPLYYVLLAPIVGPLWDSGHTLTAVMAGRMASAVLIAVAVPASAWAASRCFPGARRLPGATAVVTAFAGIVIQQGSSIYNDALYYPLVVLACGIAGAALRDGITRRLLVAATLVVAAGMTTRLSFGLWAVAVVVALLLARNVRLARDGAPARGRAALVGRIVAAAVPVLAAAAAAGWFYVRNKAITGNFSGRQAEWGIEHARRIVRPIGEIAADGGVWRGLFGIYRGAIDPMNFPTWLILLVPLVLGLAVAVVGSVRRAGRASAVAADTDRRALRSHGLAAAERRRDRLAGLLVVLMFVAVSALLVITQLDYVAGGGSPNTRYSMTVLPIIAIVMAAGLTGWRPLSGLLVTAWVVAAAFPYWTLVDLHVSGMVPHAALMVRLAFTVSVVAAVACVVGAFLDARRPRGRRFAPAPDADDQDRAAPSSSR
ncbi:hypothetical protein FHW23_002968 [Curtobacterium pusillum]|uniref:Glycosyltransferase RgtA/B/C/D-like domain-containing protein n=1 Tax=Curtobacterium pusillum TaxID=69373 RepID=A0AAW3TAJ6_9MICO|nr:hypothetical protein [Curtobacterium pusillum]MBA8991690.1 hypothetical protein [Curtobacterium pusillum]